ncbi:glycosyltransferase [Lichenihabitans sp. Uapishka_5]|uniref:glycosyltransferase n=1 Tax=Lichenihabitans sp. Uapishka_5 TaxID=3037302 RepID=UPI0029E8250D|nr:glycosyltransferase [Lichenihabitans sp. Uapishka_5]MDX7950397.1 glycosyltransferase [Lichenihabitans sp. Uapishka_5]
MRVAIVHYWLVGMRGGEKVVEALCELFPQADIFTHVYVPGAISERINAHRVQTSFIAGLPQAARRYQRYLPLMPMALEQLDLRGYDLILSSESGPSKGIIPPAGALHLCYCHSPMRYIWNMFHDYRDRSGPLTRLLMPPVSHYLRTWDAVSATRVHRFAANSQTVARRLSTYYRRDAEVIHPPVDTRAFHPVPDAERGDFFLMAGELVAYKRPDLAVEAFNRMKVPLVVAGGGEMLGRLRSLAGPTVQVLGPQSFAVLRSLYAGCKALVFPGEEDFGIVPVEAMASGRPVLAYRRGGATETVVDGLSGLFFDQQSIDAIIDAVTRFEGTDFDPQAIAAHAQRFGADVFQAGMQRFVADSLAAHG